MQILLNGKDVTSTYIKVLEGTISKKEWEQMCTQNKINKTNK